MTFTIPVPQRLMYEVGDYARVTLDYEEDPFSGIREDLVIKKSINFSNKKDIPSRGRPLKIDFENHD